jgi:predicted dehydrogenase
VGECRIRRERNNLEPRADRRRPHRKRACGRHSASLSARLAAVADAIPAAASALASQRGCEANAVAKIAIDPAINAVLVCTPTDTHADLIEQFAKAGKACFL